MTKNENAQDLRWVTHVRAMTHDVTAMPTPEVRALALVNLVVDTHGIIKQEPMVQSFATAADEHRRGMITCTPAVLASAIWEPRPPAVLVGYGGAVWDFLTPALTRGVARVDMSKVARLVWPDGPAHNPMQMAEYVVSGMPHRTCDGSPADRLYGEVQALADILSTALLVAGDMLTELATRHAMIDKVGLSDTLGSMAGDPRLEAMVRLSALQMPPLVPIPGPWDNAEAWFTLAGEDLAYIAFDHHATKYERNFASVELARRKARDEALLQPRSLLRWLRTR